MRGTPISHLKAALVILLTLPLTSTLTSMVAGNVTASENLTSSPVRMVPGPGRLVAIRPASGEICRLRKLPSSDQLLRNFCILPKSK